MSAGRSQWRRRSAIFNGQADVIPITLISPAAYLGEIHTASPSPTPVTPFCHLSLSAHVTIVTGCNIEGGKEVE